MDLEIRTGLLESRKLNTLIGITSSQDTLLFGWGEGVWTMAVLSPPSSPLICPLHASPWGCGQNALPCLQLPLITARVGCEHLEDEPAWQNPLLSSTCLLNHALSLLKMCRELRNLKEGFTEGNEEATQSGELLSLTLCCWEAFEVFIQPIFFLSWFDLL